MSTATSPPRSARPGSALPLAKPDFASLVKTKGSGLPNRYALYAPSGWGKTSLACMFPCPFVIQTKGETGLETLIENNRLPEVPHLPEIMAWSDLLAAVRWLRKSEHDYRFVVVDALNGAERLCHEAVCEREFGGDWGDKGFQGYMRGYEIALADWRNLLIELDELRSERKMGIILVNHARISTFKNPTGPDYDKYVPDMHPKTWGLTNKWVDVVLFGNFEVIVKGGSDGEKPRKGKVADSQARILYTEGQPAFEAKNRLGLPAEIDMGTSPQEAWTNFRAALKEGRSNG